MTRPFFDPTDTVAAAGMCAGKESFASPSLARKVAKRMGRIGKTVEFYRCDVCRQFHLGRPHRPVETVRRKRFLEGARS